ncbi:MAG: hypothetical protein RDU01_04005 [Thermodesulfovibrionales bacterium]|nr:hypothetical protein [Thermodesulfovibrionales bacterium]
MAEHQVLSRLEDFISLARKGEKVDLTVTLNKRIFTRKFSPHTAGESEDEIDMYILSADYFFVIEGNVNEITKFYVSGIEGESTAKTERNIYIANERLKMDYSRLKDAKIVFLEKFWDEHSPGRI